MFTYLLINAFIISFPLIRSFENKITYYKKWKFLFPALAATGFFFIVWDYLFTESGIWSFNENFILGWYIIGLPFEEWLFFITVPFACVFIYEAVKYFVKEEPLSKYSNVVIFTLMFILVVGAILNLDRLYTVTTFSLTALALVIHWFVFRTKIFGYFFIAFLIHLLPFFVINGLLTSLPVVLYNDNENLGIRIFTIPVEDGIYSFLLLLMNISIYEYLAGNKKIKTNRTSN